MVASFSVNGFRNLKHVQLKITSSLVLFCGANGQGKTNLLESISIVACGSSFRSETKDFWLPFNAESFHFSQIELALNTGLVQKVILGKGARENQVQMKFWQNDVPVSRQHFIGSVPVVAFEPQDMNIFYGDPGPRRSFLDNILVQVSPAYRQAFAQAKKVLTNRNHLLKALNKGFASVDELAFWNTQYHEVSQLIQNYRKGLVDFLQLHIARFYEKFANTRVELVVNYKNSLFDPEKYAIPEKARGFTLSGQHRDDIELFIDNRPWYAIASRGEMRTSVLALKACVIEYFTENSEYRPILLLDDVFSELDEARRKLILEWQNEYQIFLTTAADIPEITHGQVFTIDSGKVIA